jgi:hypothetical protein
LEKPKNFTVISTASATNLWIPDVSEQNQISFGLLYVVGLAVTAAVLLSALLIEKKKGVNIKSIVLKRTKILTIILTILLMGAAVSLIGMLQTQITMSFHEINLILQTIWCALLIVSMWFRAKGHNMLHGITWIVVLTITLFNFSAVILTSSPSDQSLNVFFSSPAYAAEFISHAILSFPALILGVWFIVLWSPTSNEFVAKTKWVTKATAILWVLSYIAGVLGYIALYTNYFG